MKNKVDPKDFENYLKEARTWETDKVQEMEKSQKIAWRVATASGTVAFASVMAVAMLTPLKTVEPYVIRVDNSTGIVDVVESLRDGETNYDEAINKYFKRTGRRLLQLCRHSVIGTGTTKVLRFF
jgi:type IV secretion system protein VirB8